LVDGTAGNLLNFGRGAQVYPGRGQVPTARSANSCANGIPFPANIAKVITSSPTIAPKKFIVATFNIRKVYSHLMDENSNRTKGERFGPSILSLRPR
jgi:hypothetical protein